MTKEQLHLLIEYINLKTLIAMHCAMASPASLSSFDRLAQILGELKKTVDE